MKEHLQNIGKNIFPGFVVSLIALPLSLGLALASGVPPLAGIIAGVVGGIIVSTLGGSNVTVTGAGNGLVVVTLSAVMTLGAGDLQTGYLYTLAAVVCSGGLIFLFGLLRFGALSDFFPSPAVQGMLAAIGLIIMSKQLHVMIGEVSPEASSPVELFASLHESVGSLWNGQVPVLAYVIGIASLLIMFLYARIRNPVFHLVPAPMWVVLLSVGLVYFTQKNEQTLAPLPPEYLINIPDNVFNQLAFPDFSKLATGEFMVAVISLTFIASVESLLSIKAVDKLDPQRRRSNVNKDLRAIGVATVVSGLLGGINVVSVIARSSVNVNNGATNRLSNLFHGIFLAVFVLIFTAFLQHIPLPALAAILVYTGYKLAAPSVFRDMASVGWVQFVIFLVTMIATLFTGLITGIAVGIGVTLLFQLGAIKHISTLLRNIFRPNTLLYQESDHQYHLSVRAFSNFLNFLGIKKKLDSIPRDSTVIVDFSLSEFVDHSVMDQLHDYYQNFRMAGGNLEVVGLDDLSTSSSHPLAPRQSRALPRHRKRSQITKRQQGIIRFADRLHWQTFPGEFYEAEDFEDFKYFATRIIDKGRNLLRGKRGSVRIAMADLDYHEGEFIARESLHSTMICLHLPVRVAEFVMDKENLLDRVAYLAGFRDINFKSHTDFSQRFKLKGDDLLNIRRFFNDEVINFFESNKLYHVESNGHSLLIFEKERISTLSEIKQLVSFANRLANLLNEKYSN